MQREIKVGDRFLSGSEVGEILATTRKHPTFPVIWLGETSGEVGYFTSEGTWFCDRDSERDLQPLPEPEIVIPEGVDFQITSEAMKKECLELQKSGRKFMHGRFVTVCEFDDEEGTYRMLPIAIEEGVEFSGEAYRAEFERLVKEGREFEYFSYRWKKKSGDKFSSSTRYRLLPRHLDANGKPLKVGDRVECDGERFTIESFHTQYALRDSQSGYLLRDCRKLTTRTRPLCADDLMKHRTAFFRINKMRPVFCALAFDDKTIWLSERRVPYLELQRDWEWSPSADHDWQPCEVTEEVLA